MKVVVGVIGILFGLCGIGLGILSIVMINLTGDDLLIICAIFNFLFGALLALVGIGSFRSDD